MNTIGGELRQQRESRGLSLQDVQDATKITAQNLSALEDDRFDAFPNRVYARAFLRDYSNFLGIDSDALLSRYEDEWNPAQKPEPEKPGGSALKVVAYTLIVLIVLAGLAATAYLGFKPRHRRAMTPPTTRQERTDRHVAVLPRPAPIPAAKPEPTKPETTEPEVQPAPVPPVTDKLSISVGALAQVWLKVDVDGQNAFIGIFEKGQSKSFEGTKEVKIRAGKAGAVQVKVNGELQPPLGPLGAPITKVYNLQSLPKPPTGAAPATNP